MDHCVALKSLGTKPASQEHENPRGSSPHAALAGQLCDPVVPSDGDK